MNVNAGGSLSAEHTRRTIAAVALTLGCIGSVAAQDSVRSYGQERFDSRWLSPDPGNPIVEVDAGSRYGIARHADGRLDIWGAMTATHLPDPPATPPGVHWTAVSTAYDYAVALRSDGALVLWGGPQHFLLSPVAGVGYVQVGVGQYHGIALRADGATAVWGANHWGQTNVPPLPPGVTWVAFAVDEDVSFGLRSDGRLAAFGRSIYGQLSVPQLPAGTSWVEVDTGNSHTLGRRSDGMVITWGNASAGVAPPLPPGTRYVQVAAGMLHSLALRSDGQVVAWGPERAGECTVPPLPPGLTYVSISAGDAFSLALRSDGRVIAWGAQNVAQGNVPPLPPGTRWQRMSWCGWNAALLRSDGHLHVWGAVPLSMPTGGHVDVSVGGPHGLALRTNGTLIAWGSNLHGECNVPPLPNGLAWGMFRAGGTPGGSGHSVALRSDGTAVAWGDPSYGATNVPPLPAGTRWVHADAGVRHTLLVRSDGSLFAFGANDSGQCNVPQLPPQTRYVKAAAGAMQSAALRSDGRIVVWGDPTNGVTNVPTLPAGIHFVDVQCSKVESLVAGRTSAGGVVTWGGAGLWTPIVVPPPEPGIGYLELGVGAANVVVRTAAQGSFTRFATGCAGSLAPATLVPSDTPRLGATMHVNVRELPVDTALLLAAFGATSRFGPLPMSLAPVGMPGCTAAVAEEFVYLLGGTGGEAGWSVSIPEVPHLLGVTFQLQAIVLDPGANPAGAVMSDAMRALVGGG